MRHRYPKGTELSPRTPVPFSCGSSMARRWPREAKHSGTRRRAPARSTRIPKLRKDSYFPGFLQSHRMAEKAPLGNADLHCRLAALGADGPWVFDGPMNRAAFNIYVETQPAPTLNAPRSEPPGLQGAPKPPCSKRVLPSNCHAPAGRARHAARAWRKCVPRRARSGLF